MSGIEFMSCTAEATVHAPDPNYEYHFSISGYGDDYYEWEEDGIWDRATTKYQILIDSHLPWFIKKYEIPVYYYDEEHVRQDVTLLCYCIRPYITRTNGIAVGTKNYRLRIISSGKYRTNNPDDVYGSRDMSVKFDGIITCPCNSSVKSKWTSNNGGNLSLYGWDQEDPELQISDNDSYLSIIWWEDSYYDSYLAASPYDVTTKVTAFYFPFRVTIGEMVYGEAPQVGGAFGTVRYYYNTPLYDSSAGINFGNNPIFTGTYDEYRTYCENLVRNGS